MDATLNIAIRHLRDLDLDGLKKSFSMLSVEERRRIVNEKVDDNSAFYLACKEGALEFVEYMLDYCEADITQNGTFDDNKRILHVPPIWASAAEGKLDVVKCLVRHSASVNTTTDTGSTPVRASSYGGHYDTVKFLIDHGADVNKANSCNSTPLSPATQNDEALCELLINNGASVNFKDDFGYTPLTHVVEDGRLDLVRLFMSNGGDCNIRKSNNDTILQAAALFSTKPVLDYLIQHASSLKKVNIIEAYELHGCTLVDTYNDLDKALFVWEKAMALRGTISARPVPKAASDVRVNAYEGCVEPTTLAEYQRKWERHEVHMNALLVRERILGKSHRSTIYGINFRAGVYYDNRNYKRCLELWKYSYILSCEHYPATDEDPIRTAQMIISLFFVIESEMHAQQTETRVTTSDFLHLFNMVLKQAERGFTEVKNRPLEEFTEGNYNCLLIVILHFINFRFNLELTEKENDDFLLGVKRIVKANPKTDKGNTLLHLSLIKENSTVNNQFCSRFPSSRQVELLVNSGACVNSTNDSMNTALHLVIPQILSNDDDDECVQIVNYLLRNKVHLDIINNEGHCVLTWLENRGFPVCPARHKTLACLAATAVVEYDIPFESVLSSFLADFVKLHGFQYRNIQARLVK